MKITLKRPELMNIINVDREVFIGGSQKWYEDNWHRKSGCGPVAASNLIIYIMRKNGLNPNYFELMREMYDFVTPTIRGVNTSSIFTNGIEGYSSKYAIQISSIALEIPKSKRKRPNTETVKDFLSAALHLDSPVAFLNLSNGTLLNLENYHWVTIVAMDTETMLTDISDHGKILEINISEWLETSILGGVFVYIT